MRCVHIGGIHLGPDHLCHLLKLLSGSNGIQDAALHALPPASSLANTLASTRAHQASLSDYLVSNPCQLSPSRCTVRTWRVAHRAHAGGVWHTPMDAQTPSHHCLVCLQAGTCCRPALEAAWPQLARMRQASLAQHRRLRTRPMPTKPTQLLTMLLVGVAMWHCRRGGCHACSVNLL